MNATSKTFLRDAMRRLNLTRDAFSERLGVRRRALDTWLLPVRLVGAGRGAMPPEMSSGKLRLPRFFSARRSTPAPVRIRAKRTDRRSARPQRRG